MTLAELRATIDTLIANGTPPETVVFVPRFNYYTGAADRVALERVPTQTRVDGEWVDTMSDGVVIR